MSKRNAYRISVTTKEGYMYEQLRRRLDELFNGHFEETSYGFYAEDSPGVDSAFSDGDARYVTENTFIRAMNEDFFEGWADDNWLDARDSAEEISDSDQPEDAGKYVDIIDSVVHEYANDTSGAREETELNF